MMVAISEAVLFSLFVCFSKPYWFGSHVRPRACCMWIENAIAITLWFIVVTMPPFPPLEVVWPRSILSIFTPGLSCGRALFNYKSDHDFNARCKKPHINTSSY